MNNLRSWSTESKERTWAMAISAVAFTLVATLIIFSQWPAETKTTDKIEANITNNTALSDKTFEEKAQKKQLILSHEKKVDKPPHSTQQATSIPPQKKHNNKTSPLSKGYFIQVGAFEKKSYAHQLGKRLSSKHWPALIQRKKVLYAVQIGPYKSKKTAIHYKSKLLQQEKLNGFIIHRSFP